MVIAIHTRPFLMMQNYIDGGIQILVRIAVPFFFCVTGYFLKEAVSESGATAILNTLKKTFFLYLKWSVVYFAVIFLQNPELISVDSLKWMTIDFFVNGSYGHLWYMVALLWCLPGLYLVQILNAKKILVRGTVALYILGLLGTSYYFVGLKIPGLSLLFQSSYFTMIRRIWFMGFPFIVLGWVISEKKIGLLSISFSRTIIALLITFVLFVLEIFAVTVTGMARSVVITFFLYPLVALVFVVCLKHPMVKYEKLGTYCGTMSGFIYFIHPLVILLLKRVGIVANKLQFLLTTTLCVLLSAIVAFCQLKGRRKR